MKVCPKVDPDVSPATLSPLLPTWLEDVPNGVPLPKRFTFDPIEGMVPFPKILEELGATNTGLVPLPTSVVTREWTEGVMADRVTTPVVSSAWATDVLAIPDCSAVATFEATENSLSLMLDLRKNEKVPSVDANKST